MIRRLDAYAPWNIGNYSLDEANVRARRPRHRPGDQEECAAHGILWIPTVYPGFSWDNLTRQPPGSSLIERRGGLKFLWEQFVELHRLGCDTVHLSMFDEVDEGTALFKVTSEPPENAHFVGYDGLPSDWYCRLVREGIAMAEPAALPGASTTARAAEDRGGSPWSGGVLLLACPASLGSRTRC